VASFLEGKITFLGIENMVERALEKHRVIKNPDLGTIQQTDAETRQYISSLLPS